MLKESKERYAATTPSSLPLLHSWIKSCRFVDCVWMRSPTSLSSSHCLCALILSLVHSSTLSEMAVPHWTIPPRRRILGRSDMVDTTYSRPRKTGSSNDQSDLSKTRDFRPFHIIAWTSISVDQKAVEFGRPFTAALQFLPAFPMGRRKNDDTV